MKTESSPMTLTLCSKSQVLTKSPTEERVIWTGVADTKIIYNFRRGCVPNPYIPNPNPHSHVHVIVNSRGPAEFLWREVYKSNLRRLRQFVYQKKFRSACFFFPTGAQGVTMCVCMLQSFLSSPFWHNSSFSQSAVNFNFTIYHLYMRKKRSPSYQKGF